RRRAVPTRRSRCARGRDLPSALDGAIRNSRLWIGHSKSWTSTPDSRLPNPGQAPHLAAISSTNRRMIAFLRGRALDQHPNRISIDVNGVGYEVHVPLSTYYDLGEEGADVALRVHTHVREDAIQLFGFLTRLEQLLFERLIAIGGIGPRLA